METFKQGERLKCAFIQLLINCKYFYNCVFDNAFDYLNKTLFMKTLHLIRSTCFFRFFLEIKILLHFSKRALVYFFSRNSQNKRNLKGHELFFSNHLFHRWDFKRFYENNGGHSQNKGNTWYLTAKRAADKFTYLSHWWCCNWINHSSNHNFDLARIKGSWII